MFCMSNECRTVNVNGSPQWERSVGCSIIIIQEKGGLNSALKDKRIWTGREGITSSLEDLTKHLCNICRSARMYRLSFEP